MSVVEPGSAQSNLIQRVKDILLRPAQTWEVIDVEPTTTADLYKRYIIPLAAIPAVAGFIGFALVGVGVPGLGFKTGIVSTAVSQAVQFLLTLGMTFVLALIIDGLAPTFGGQKNQIQALKVAAYSTTAWWVAGVVLLIPMLAPLMLLGLYSLYLFYTGLPRLMKTPAEKSVPYVAVVILAAIVVGLVVSMIVSPLQRMGSVGPFGARDAGEIQIGDTRVNLGELEAAAKKMEKAAEQMEAAAEGKGSGGATDPAAFKGYLPTSIAGYTRTELSTGSGGVGGIEGSSATATYAKGDSNMTLTVTDLGAMGALAALGGAFNVESTSEENGRYEKVGKVNGRMTMEEYDNSSRHGSYGVMVGERFMVQAEGDGVTMDELKSAVAAINPGRLEKLANAQ
jgi:hypothetical protein